MIAVQVRRLVAESPIALVSPMRIQELRRKQEARTIREEHDDSIAEAIDSNDVMRRR